MKLILIALSISLFLVTIYYIFTVIASSLFFGNSPFEMEPFLNRPTSLPRTLYVNIAPDFIQNAAASSPIGGLIERILFFFGNVLIYSIPIYGLLSIFKRRRKS